ncbi:MAG: hypothetical protein M3003_15175 [Candidatus Dormibacteraeota bacterium]|nr:hypothetical protein [Candidatus Dormibacteraeota bacterium]
MDDSAPPGWAMKLAAIFHLEWCPSCQDWRDLGHTSAEDQRKRSQASGQAQNALEESEYPTLG